MATPESKVLRLVPADWTGLQDMSSAWGESAKKTKWMFHRVKDTGMYLRITYIAVLSRRRWGFRCCSIASRLGLFGCWTARVASRLGLFDCWKSRVLLLIAHRWRQHWPVGKSSSFAAPKKPDTKQLEMTASIMKKRKQGIQISRNGCVCNYIDKKNTQEAGDSLLLWTVLGSPSMLKEQIRPPFCLWV